MPLSRSPVRRATASSFARRRHNNELKPSLRAKRSNPEAGQSGWLLDCFVALLLAMTGWTPRNEPMPSGANIVVYAGLLIGLTYGAVGLLSGFCLTSSLRGWWAQGDSRLIRSYALALGVAIAATQLLAARGVVDLGKSIYLQPSFSAPLMFFGGLLFGYGMVLSNGCGSRALVLLGRGNLRSFVVVIVLGISAQMTLKGLVAPARIALLQASQATTSVNSVPALLSAMGLGEITARMVAASVISA